MPYKKYSNLRKFGVGKELNKNGYVFSDLEIWTFINLSDKIIVQIYLCSMWQRRLL